MKWSEAKEPGVYRFYHGTSASYYRKFDGHWFLGHSESIENASQSTASAEQFDFTRWASLNLHVELVADIYGQPFVQPPPPQLELF